MWESLGLYPTLLRRMCSWERLDDLLVASEREVVAHRLIATVGEEQLVLPRRAHQVAAVVRHRQAAARHREFQRDRLRWLEVDALKIDELT